MKRLSPPTVPAILATPLAIGAHLALCLYHRLRGYTSPGTKPHRDPEGALRYDLSVIDGWFKELARYTGGPFSFEGKRILELCPGPDLGIGAVLLARGAASYTAVDINPLVDRATPEFYEMLLARLDGDPERVLPIDIVREELLKARRGVGERLQYRLLPNFDLSCLAPNGYDLVVSQAAVEHFTDPAKSFRTLAPAVATNGLILLQIDLKTHTPWLRDLDPLSIYRVPKWLYDRTEYPGVPNRLSTTDYTAILEAAGFCDIALTSLEEIESSYLKSTLSVLSAPYRDRGEVMCIMSCYIAAKRATAK